MAIIRQVLRENEQSRPDLIGGVRRPGPASLIESSESSCFYTYNPDRIGISINRLDNSGGY